MCLVCVEIVCMSNLMHLPPAILFRTVSCLQTRVLLLILRILIGVCLRGHPYETSMMLGQTGRLFIHYCGFQSRTETGIYLSQPSWKGLNSFCLWRGNLQLWKGGFTEILHRKITIVFTIVLKKDKMPLIDLADRHFGDSRRKSRSWSEKPYYIIYGFVWNRDTGLICVWNVVRGWKSSLEHLYLLYGSVTPEDVPPKDFKCWQA